VLHLAPDDGDSFHPSSKHITPRKARRTRAE
jgi:hypothetical protein